MRAPARKDRRTSESTLPVVEVIAEVCEPGYRTGKCPSADHEGQVLLGEAD